MLFPKVLTVFPKVLTVFPKVLTVFPKVPIDFMSESCGGGGGSTPESGWGKDKDEDERAYARRCLKMAHSMCKPKPRQRSFHR